MTHLMPHRRLGPATRAVVGTTAVFMVGAVAGPRPLLAQPVIAGTRGAIAPGVWFDLWSFGGTGARQPSLVGARTVRVTRVAEASVPIGVVMPLPHQWTFDLSTAFASGTITLATADSGVQENPYSLAGLADTKLRLTGPLGTPNVRLTIGLNLPTGKTKLDDEQLSALRVLASPALALRTPVLGNGAAATAGLIFATKSSDLWGWALGISYERRAKYSPLAAVAGALPELVPSDVVRLSLGGDGFVGQSGLTVNVGVDVFTQDRYTPAAVGGGSASPVTTKLGPIVSTGLQYRVGNTPFRDLTLYVMDRFRSGYTQGGKSIAQSGANYLDAGVSSDYLLARNTGLIAGANVRHHTGLQADTTLAAAGLLSVGATLGLSQRLPNGSDYAIEPLIHAQVGSIKTAGAESVSAKGVSFGVQLSRRF